MNRIPSCKALLWLTVMACWVHTASAADKTKEASANFGLNLSSGNSDALTFHLGGRLADVLPSYAWHVTAEGNYGEAGTDITVGDETVSRTEKTIQNARGVAYYSWRFDRNYVFTENSIYHDEMTGLDARIILGLGYGYDAIKSETMKLGLEAGLSYVAEYVSSDDDDAYPALRLGTRHDQALSETARVWSTVAYLPRLDNWRDYLLNAEVGIEAAINSHVALRFVLQDIYNSIPLADNERNDLTIIGAISFMLYPE